VKKHFRSKSLYFILMPILAFLYLSPFLYMLLRSFLRFDQASLFNYSPTLFNYETVLTGAKFGHYFLNSLIVLVAVLFANIFFSVPVAYAFSRYEFPFKKLLYATVLLSLVLPYHIMLFPILNIAVKTNIYDTLFALIIPFALNGFNVFFLKRYIDALPEDLEHTARVDGAGEFAILRHVVFPLTRPALAIVAINTVITTWNSFIFPLILTETSKARTLPVALSYFSQGAYATDWGILMAASGVSSLPLVLIFWFFQKQIINGMTAGSLKE